jgi:hypothetical protein
MPASENLFRRYWVVYAPWAHPAWNNYAMMLVDLTTPMDEPPVLFDRKFTHELSLWALHPDRDRVYPQGKLPGAIAETVTVLFENVLRPPNHVYQFKDTNEGAELRGETVYSLIRNQTISPDTDFRSMWDGLYPDWIGGHTQKHLSRKQ